MAIKALEVIGYKKAGLVPYSPDNSKVKQELFMDAASVKSSITTVGWKNKYFIGKI